jgi:hypothetical protein
MTKKRGKTGPTARLSEQMKQVLLWVYNYERPESAPQTYITTLAGIMLNNIVDGFVPWRPSEFLGEKPTPSKTATLSNALKRLDERGLLNRYSVISKAGKVIRMTLLKDRGERMQTSHVNLTREGAVFVQALAHDDFDLELDQARRVQATLERQEFGLRLAVGLLRERINEDRNDDGEQEAHLALSAVEESLNQVQAKIEDK